ncbi:MAG: ABC transporter substrate-binding protein [Actinomycetota bacterium]
MLSIKQSVRLGAGALTLVVLASSCGDDDGAESNASETVVTAAADVTTEPTAATTEAIGGAAATAPDGAPIETVTVTDATGEITVPITTEGIVALDEFTALNLLSLGVRADTTLVQFQTGLLEPILEAEGLALEVGVPFEVNLELVASLAPDLVAGVPLPAIVDARDQIDEEIAPVVVVDFFGTDWRTQLELLASVTGTTERKEELEATVDAAIDELAADIEAAGLGGTTVSFLEATAEGPAVGGNDRQAGEILRRVGLERPAAEDLDGTGVEPISLEDLADHDAEFMLVSAGVEPSANDSPLRSEDGVKAEVFYWDSEDVLGALAIVTDLRRLLPDEQPPLGADAPLQMWNRFLAE